MNIFILDKDMNKSIQYLPDKHIVKMPLESTQLLCNTYHILGQADTQQQLYKPTHLKHPCSLWVAESLDNWMWLKEYTRKIGEEYTYRYGKHHKSVMLAEKLISPNLERKGITDFAKCVPAEFNELETIEAYREYFIENKQHLKTYTKRNIPEWWTD